MIDVVGIVRWKKISVVELLFLPAYSEPQY